MAAKQNIIVVTKKYFCKKAMIKIGTNNMRKKVNKFGQDTIFEDLNKLYYLLLPPQQNQGHLIH